MHCRLVVEVKLGYRAERVEKEGEKRKKGRMGDKRKNENNCWEIEK